MKAAADGKKILPVRKKKDNSFTLLWFSVFFCFTCCCFPSFERSDAVLDLYSVEYIIVLVILVALLVFMMDDLVLFQCQKVHLYSV